jgi:hypothetical protein
MTDWTTPITYTTDEFMTAAIGNTQWRDNLTYLKTSADSRAPSIELYSWYTPVWSGLGVRVFGPAPAILAGYNLVKVIASVGNTPSSHVSVTGMSYASKTVTLHGSHNFLVGETVTVAGVNAGFSVTNVDGTWVLKTGTDTGVMVFDVTDQPVGATPQTLTAGTVTNLVQMRISRGRQSAPGSAYTWAAMLSTNVYIDEGEYSSLTAATQMVVDASYDDILEGDMFAFDVIAAGTGASGLFMTPEFQKP